MKLHLVTLFALYAAAAAYSDSTGLRSGIADVDTAEAEDSGGEESRRSLGQWKLPKITIPKLPTIPTLPKPTIPTAPPTMKPVTEKCGVYTASTSVQAMFLESATNWGKCETYLSTISSSTSTINTNVGYVNTALTAAEKVSNTLKTTANSVYNAAYAGLSKLQSIPKVGKVIKAFLQILDKARKLLDKVWSRLSSVKKLMDKIGKAFKAIAYTFKGLVASAKTAKVGYNTASSVTKTSIDCTKNTETCADDTQVEQYNSNIKNSVSSQLSASKKCPSVFESIAKVLSALANAIKESVFKAIQKAVEALEKVLKPIMDTINKIMKEIKDHLSEAYCCATPYGLQVGLKVIGQVLDLATCPVDGMQKGIDAAMKVLEDAMNNMIKMVLTKILAPVSNIALLVPTIDAGSVKTCKIDFPSVSTKMVYPFQPWIDALKYDKPSVAVFEHAALAFGNEIINTCKDAANEVGTKLKHDCCKDYRPLSDGKFCDPTSSVPYKKCTQCSSGTHSWWFDRFHIACGKAPCGKDGAHCGLGTTCNQCCNGHSYWWGKAFTACGKEPCWGDGKRCGLGTTCKACCRSAKFWSSKLFTACGSEPCWGGGTRCLGGTTCKKCCGGSKWEWKKVGHFCK